jgi:hypothetical protein
MVKQRRFWLILVIVLTLLGASVQAQDTGITTIRSPLTASDNLWPSAVIPVCWENPASSNVTERGWVQNQLEQTWEKESAVDFVGWSACNNASRGIRVQIRDEMAAPHTKDLGTALDGRRNGMVLNFTFRNWSTDCASPESRRQFCVRVIAVHEFGHALGFAHEQNRSDSFLNCALEHQGSDPVWDVTPFDIRSVMNYCNPRWGGDGQLSMYDVQGVRRIYGSPNQSRVIPGYDMLGLSRTNNPSQLNLFCTLQLERDLSHVVDFKRSETCPNDSARSMILLNVSAPRVLRLYDSPEGIRNDDWVEIIVKRNVVNKVIRTFERNFEDQEVKIIYHGSDNDLDGAVSRLIASYDPEEATVDLYEGTNAGGSLVCSIFVVEVLSLELGGFSDGKVDLSQVENCDNDEASSVRLLNVRPGLILRLYDRPQGMVDDDWIEIEVKRSLTSKVIGSLERSFEDSDVRVRYYSFGNDLNDAVSRLEIGPRNPETAPVPGYQPMGLWTGLANTGRFNTSLWDRWASSAWMPVATGDFDGDGQDDMLRLDASASNTYLQRVWVSTDWDVTSEWAWWNTNSWLHLAVGDFNGDGLDDIMKIDVPDSGYQTLGLWVGLSDGRQFNTRQWARWDSSRNMHVHVGDFNGDGLDDIMKIDVPDSGYSTLGLWVGLSDGSRFNTRQWARWDSSRNMHVHVGDFNGDGLDDIMKIDVPQES